MPVVCLADSGEAIAKEPLINSASRFFLFALGCMAILAVCTVDLLTPLGIEIWVFYLPIILSMVFLNSSRLIASLAMTCSGLVIFCRFASPPGFNPDWWDVVNRGMGIMAIWLTAGAGIALCRRSKQLSKLERKDREREILEITTNQQQMIGQDLHDGLGQELTGLGLMAQTLAQLLTEESMGNRIASRLIAGIDHTHRLVRNLSRGLVAIEVDAGGLIAALRELAKWTTENTGITVRMDGPESFGMPDQATATHVFRIVQEAVSNALRHGQPRNVCIIVSSESSGLRLEIKDDGIGLRDKAETGPGLGLRIMRYRAGLIGGVLRIDLSDQGGAAVTLTLPPRKSDDSNAGER